MGNKNSLLIDILLQSIMIAYQAARLKIKKVKNKKGEVNAEFTREIS